MTQTAIPAKRDIWLAVRRGLALRCPQCGKGRILAGYLKQAEACSCCGLRTGDIRADDGPAWATILVTGHLVSPAFIIFAHRDANFPLLPFLIVAGLVVAIGGVLLPRMKGLFISVIWAMRAGEAMADEPL
ncbi:MAG: DUF983 domain-containing protein [Alphaproteobacteria bacterium]|nr:DUF983 domain-containing protein [Alphaproteobacteria bacterium]